MIVTVLTVVGSVALMFGGQLLRVRVFNTFIESYGVMGVRRVLAGHFLGFMASAVLPFRLGDAARAVFLSRGSGMSLGVVAAAVVLERLLDVFCFGLALLVYGSVTTSTVALWIGGSFAAGSAIVFTAALLCVRVSDNRLHGIVLRIVAHAPSRYRERLLGLLWLAARLLQGMSARRWVRVLGLTAIIWILYGSALIVLAHVVRDLIGPWLSTSASQSFLPPVVALPSASRDAVMVFLLLALPMCLLGIVALFMRTSAGAMAEAVRGAPQRPPSTGNEASGSGGLVARRLPGLDNPLEQLDREISWDGAVPVRRLPGGSGARVWVMARDDLTFVRKVVLPDAGARLMAQVDFATAQSPEYGFPALLNVWQGRRAIGMDMEYIDAATRLDAVMQAEPTSTSALIDETWMAFIAPRHLRECRTPQWAAQVDALWAQKVLGNLALCEHLVPELVAPDQIEVNGRCLDNLRILMPKMEALFRATPPRLATDYVHGDLTLSNILRCDSEEGRVLRALDPNPMQPLMALEVDIGKILQSVMGRYETLESTEVISFDGMSLRYDVHEAPFLIHAEQRVSDLTARHFGSEVASAARIQCFIHFVRLLPYRIAFDRRRVGIYYARTLELGNDLVESSASAGGQRRNAS